MARSRSICSKTIANRVILPLLGVWAFLFTLPASASSAADRAGWQCSPRLAIEIPINVKMTPKFDNFVRGVATKRAIQRHDVSSLDLFGGFGYPGVTNTFNRYLASVPGLLLKRSCDSVSGVRRVRSNIAPRS